MKILISGATGFIGSHLIPFLENKGHEIYSLVLGNDSSEDKIKWNPLKGSIDRDKIPQIDAVINLAGANIASGRWTRKKKQLIKDSRLISTKVLVDTLKALDIKPKVWINASAVGIYGHRGVYDNKEDDKPSDDFLAKVCAEWEKEAFNAQEICQRVVALRFGMVLDKSGGALAKMLPVFKLGIGGKLGSGQQYYSWVALEDLLNIINFSLENEISGIYNATSPHVPTNAEFTDAISQALAKPAVIPVPALPLRIAYGEMADAVLLSSTKASSNKLKEAGYDFKYVNIYDFMRENLKDNS